MKIVVLVAVLGASAPLAEAQARRTPAAPPAQPVAPDRTAQAYDQFLRAHMLEAEDIDAAIAAYKRAQSLDPTASAIPADLAELYMREGRPADAITAAEQALTLDAKDQDAHRVLGTVYATMGSAPEGPRLTRAMQQENFAKAIQHLEQAFDPPISAADANLRAMLARLYMALGTYDKAIPILADLVKQEPGWSDGPNLLTEAYSAAGRGADAVTWLEESAADNPQLYGTLGDYYARSRRYADAASAYERAIKASGGPRSFDLRVRLASSLLEVGGRSDFLRARDVLNEALAIRSDDTALYYLSQAERGLGDSAAACDR
jgi:tetratricopeptide (TPR) repeat protein